MSVSQETLCSEYLSAIKLSLKTSTESLHEFTTCPTLIERTFDGSKQSFLRIAEAISRDPVMEKYRDYCVSFLLDGIQKVLEEKDFEKASGFSVTHYGHGVVRLLKQSCDENSIEVVNLEISDFLDELEEDLTAVTVQEVYDKLRGEIVSTPNITIGGPYANAPGLQDSAPAAAAPSSSSSSSSSTAGPSSSSLSSSSSSSDSFYDSLFSNSAISKWVHDHFNSISQADPKLSLALGVAAGIAIYTQEEGE